MKAVLNWAKHGYALVEEVQGKVHTSWVCGLGEGRTRPLKINWRVAGGGGGGGGGRGSPPQQRDGHARPTTTGVYPRPTSISFSIEI